MVKDACDVCVTFGFARSWSSWRPSVQIQQLTTAPCDIRIHIYIYLDPVCSPFWWIDMDYASLIYKVPKIRYLCKKPCFFDFGGFQVNHKTVGNPIVWPLSVSSTPFFSPRPTKLHTKRHAYALDRPPQNNKLLTEHIHELFKFHDEPTVVEQHVLTVICVHSSWVQISCSQSHVG